MSQNRFDEIYSNNEWECGSGVGSLDVQTRGYREYLQKFMKDNKVTSVVDMGCGDWQFSRLVDWSNVSYQGFDVVSSVVAENVRNYSDSNISFSSYSGDPAELPASDLIIIKDVLQHLPNKAVLNVLPQLKRYKYALITNCINPKGICDNTDIELGGFRYIDLHRPPFDLEAQEVFSFEKVETGLLKRLKAFFRGYPQWRKSVLLVNNSAVG